MPSLSAIWFALEIGLAVAALIAMITKHRYWRVVMGVFLLYIAVDLIRRGSAML